MGRCRVSNYLLMSSVLIILISGCGRDPSSAFQSFDPNTQAYSYFVISSDDYDFDNKTIVDFYDKSGNLLNEVFVNHAGYYHSKQADDDLLLLGSNQLIGINQKNGIVSEYSEKLQSGIIDLADLNGDYVIFVEDHGFKYDIYSVQLHMVNRKTGESTTLLVNKQILDVRIDKENIYYVVIDNANNASFIKMDYDFNVLGEISLGAVNTVQILIGNPVMLFVDFSKIYEINKMDTQKHVEFSLMAFISDYDEKYIIKNTANKTEVCNLKDSCVSIPAKIYYQNTCDDGKLVFNDDNNRIFYFKNGEFIETDLQFKLRDGYNVVGLWVR